MLKGVKIKEKQAQLEREKKELENMKKKAEATRAEREQEYKELLREETISRQVADNLAKSRKQQMRELERKRRQVEKLNREIESILSKAVKTQQKEKTPIDYTLSGMFEQNKGKLPWPVAKGVVIGKYGVHYHPVYKNLKLPENNGIDISTSRNAEVLCVFDGVVKQIIMMPGYNQCVLVQHGNYFTFYCKLKKVSIKNGRQSDYRGTDRHPQRRGQYFGTAFPDLEGNHKAESCSMVETTLTKETKDYFTPRTSRRKPPV
jgi:septal ring factor EnvC (AmiA/AmiB activator)